MKTRELDYDFDPSLVATAPASPRDAARLMVVDRARGAIDHRLVRDLPSILRAGDHLFVNETSVLRARLSLHDDPRGRHTEGLLLEPAAEPGAWRILVRQAKRFSDGDRLALREATGRDHGDAVEVALDVEARGIPAGEALVERRANRGIGRGDEGGEVAGLG